ncbi:MAG: hypothetical protein J3Q66DRAFT_326941 [Benniella sp.]|nr:MAG: hypothetical protein J3Q66DRAFT_326941 [Benniella sp.]
MQSTLVSPPFKRLQPTLVRPLSIPSEANSMAASEMRPQADSPMYNLSGIQPPERLSQPTLVMQHSSSEASSAKPSGSMLQSSLATPSSNAQQNSTSSAPEQKAKETSEASLAHKWQTMTIGEINGTPVVSDNKISNKAQGESIVRATVHILSRDFTYMNKELFLTLYQQLFGSPKPGDIDKVEVQSFLGSKITTDFIQVLVRDNTKWYRLNPVYFERIAVLYSIPPLMKMDDLFFSMSNRVGLPPIRSMDPRIIANMIVQLEPKLISIGWRYEALCPSRILDSEPLYDLRRYLTVWHPASPPNLSGHTIQGPNATTQNFGHMLQKARGCGMDAKSARKYLSSHSSKVLESIEKERQKEIAKMLEQCEHVGGTSPNTTISPPGSDRDRNKVECTFATHQVYDLIDSDHDMDVDGVDFFTSARNPRASTPAGRVVGEGNEMATASVRSLEGTLNQEQPMERRHESELTREVIMDEPRPLPLMQDPCGLKGGKRPFGGNVSDPEFRTTLQMPTTFRPIDHEALISTTQRLPMSKDSLVKRQHTEGQPSNDRHALMKLRDRIEFVDLTKDSDTEREIPPKGPNPIHADLRVMKNTGGLHALERIDSRKQDLMVKIQGSDSGKSGASKLNQGGQRQILKQQRFKPYPGTVQANEVSSGVSGIRSDSGNISFTQGGKALGYIPPSEDGIFTLPRPILPPLDGKGIHPNVSSSTTMQRVSGVSMVGSEESSLTMAGQLLSTTRDQILKARRAALDVIIDYTWKMPLNRVSATKHAASGLPPSSTAQHQPS